MFERSIRKRFLSGPFHSAKPNTKNVYHDNIQCTEGDDIEYSYLVLGTGGRPRCEQCDRLTRDGK